MKINQGSSLLALIILGKKKGFELICVTACNAIFVLNEFYQLFGLTSNHITSLYSPISDGRIIHRYDSHIHVCGMDRLNWSGIKVSSDDFQVLPVSLGKFSEI